MPKVTKLLILDCDSTLSAIEGIDELARRSGPDAFAEIESLTRDAMDGKLRVEDVYAARLDIIRPTRLEMAAIAQLYIDTLEPDASPTLNFARSKGWTPLILSGGCRQAILPLAEHLGIERVEAVDIYFHADGSYRDFDRNHPATRSGGKPEIIQSLRAELNPAKIIMVGDGNSDLETKPQVDQFIGFGRYAAREKVKQEATHFIMSFAELSEHLG